MVILSRLIALNVRIREVIKCQTQLQSRILIFFALMGLVMEVPTLIISA